MLKAIAVVLSLLASSVAFAAGTVPSVNTDMGCTVTGQAITYDGSTLSCLAPTRPSTTVGGLPTCNSGSQGRMYFVTDALAPVALAIVAAGGAVKIGVTCNATNWIVQ